MKRRKFLKAAGKGIAGVLAAASISPVFSRSHGQKEQRKNSIEIKTHPLAVARKNKNNRAYERT